jgi:hypothetical protein
VESLAPGSGTLGPAPNAFDIAVESLAPGTNAFTTGPNSFDIAVESLAPGTNAFTTGPNSFDIAVESLAPGLDVFGNVGGERGGIEGGVGEGDASPLSMASAKVNYQNAVADAMMFRNGVFEPGVDYRVELPQLDMGSAPMIKVSDIATSPTIGQLTAGTQGTAPVQYASGGRVKQPDSPIDGVQGLLRILQSYLQKSGSTDPDAFAKVKRSLMAYLSMGKPYFVSNQCIFLYEEKSPGVIEFHIMNGGSVRDMIAGATEFIDKMAQKYSTAFTYYDNPIISEFTKYSHVPVRVKRVNGGVDRTFEMTFDLGAK